MIGVSIIVWLMMQGQSSAYHMWIDNNGTPPYTWTCSGACNKETLCRLLDCMPVSSEHVIEIRTRRHKTGKTRACYFITTGKGSACDVIPTPKYCPKDAQCDDDYTMTRELWIDGKRIGIIRGLD